MNEYTQHAWELLKAHPGEWFTMDALLDGMVPPVCSRDDYYRRMLIANTVSHYLSKYAKIGWVEIKRQGRRALWRWAE